MDANYTTHWDPTDDYSRDGLILDEYTRTEKITAYQDGALVWGEEPEGRPLFFGDVNRDGTVNLPDIVLLQKHLCNKATLKKRNAVAADLNADGAITILDAVLLKRKLL